MQVSKKAGLPSRLLAGLLTAALSIPAIVPVAYAQNSSQEQAAKLSQAQLESLVAPIALYPDSLLSQVLMASTYPLEVAEAANWQNANKNLKGNALNNALQQQTWDASVKSLVSFPSALQMMGSQLSWTQKLGNAVLAQQSNTMAAIQTLRAKAKQSGALQSTQQQTVSTQGRGSSQAIIIQPADPQVVYVPAYNPTVVYGAWPYPSYPPYTYYPPGYVAGTALLSFGVGMAVGAALWGGCHWGGGYGGGNSLTVNNNTYNNFNRNTNRNWSGNGRGTSDWKPDQQRRNANLGGGNQNAEREQLRQNLQKDGLNGGDRAGNNGGDRAGNNRSDADHPDANREGDRNLGDRSGGQNNFRNDSSGFGDARGAKFNSGGGDRFGGGGARIGGGGQHFGGGGGGFRGRR